MLCGYHIHGREWGYNWTPPFYEARHTYTFPFIHGDEVSSISWSCLMKYNLDWTLLTRHEVMSDGEEIWSAHTRWSHLCVCLAHKRFVGPICRSTSRIPLPFYRKWFQGIDIWSVVLIQMMIKEFRPAGKNLLPSIIPAPSTECRIVPQHKVPASWLNMHVTGSDTYRNLGQSHLWCDSRPSELCCSGRFKALFLKFQGITYYIVICWQPASQ